MNADLHFLKIVIISYSRYRRNSLYFLWRSPLAQWLFHLRHVQNIFGNSWWNASISNWFSKKLLWSFYRWVVDLSLMRRTSFALSVRSRNWCKKRVEMDVEECESRMRRKENRELREREKGRKNEKWSPDYVIILLLSLSLNIYKSNMNILIQSFD